MLLWAADQQGADTSARCLVISCDSATTGPDARAFLATIQRLWPLVVEATQNSYFDLHLGGLINFATAGALAYVSVPTRAARLLPSF